MIAPENALEIDALNADRGEVLGYVRVAGRRRAKARLDEPIASVPTVDARKSLLPDAG